AVRNSLDLNAMSVPAKYRAIGDFHEYYSGARLAPYLTLFVGGNHEASNHLWELYYGGWVAPNIYYLGAANVVNVGPLRIAGLSGIWAGYDYRKSHFERLPYGNDEVKSIYHVRELDTRKLLQVRTQVDVGVSHDWPKGIEWKGNHNQLFRFKPHFQTDAKTGKLGSAAAKYVMDRLRPKWWFAAHLHCKFSAIVDHGDEAESGGHATQKATEEINGAPGSAKNVDRIVVDEDPPQAPNEGGIETSKIHNNDEIDLDMDDEVAPISEPPSTIEPSITDREDLLETNAVPADLRAQLPAAFSRPEPTPATQTPCPEAIKNTTTQFLALDKCLPNRRFLQIMEVDPISETSKGASNRPFSLTYDKEWLAITRAFASIDPLTGPIPSDRGEIHYRPLIETEESWVEENLVKPGKMIVPENFEITAPVYDPGEGLHPKEHPREYTNPQTVAFCKMLGIENYFDRSEEERRERRDKGPAESTNSGRGGGGRGRSRGFHGRGRGRSRGPR
ncbi:MAG: hypothetical protein Q9183_004765, partial [Haloplaca sp. 2 TL-2023]